MPSTSICTMARRMVAGGSSKVTPMSNAKPCIMALPKAFAHRTVTPAPENIPGIPGPWRHGAMMTSGIGDDFSDVGRFRWWLSWYWWCSMGSVILVIYSGFWMFLGPAQWFRAQSLSHSQRFRACQGERKDNAQKRQRHIVPAIGQPPLDVASAGENHQASENIWDGQNHKASFLPKVLEFLGIEHEETSTRVTRVLLSKLPGEDSQTSAGVKSDSSRVKPEW